MGSKANPTKVTTPKDPYGQAKRPHHNHTHHGRPPQRTTKPKPFFKETSRILTKQEEMRRRRIIIRKIDIDNEGGSKKLGSKCSDALAKLSKQLVNITLASTVAEATNVYSAHYRT
jgi:hypothetical protein